MALSGSVSTNKYNSKVGLKLTWTGSQNIAANTTTISWKLVSDGGSSGNWWYAAPITVVIDGRTVLNITSRFKLYGGGAFSRSGSITVNHNENGTKNVAMSVKGAIYSGSVNCTGSKTFTLNSIARNPTAPTEFTISAGFENFVAVGDIINLEWSGATGVITGYEIQYMTNNSQWVNLKTESNTSTTDSFTDTNISVTGAGNPLQYRVRAMNGDLSSDWCESNILYFSGGMEIKVNNEWKMGSVWININGVWKRAKRIYIKKNEQWNKSK